VSDAAFADWEARTAAVSKIADTLTPRELVRTIDALASERPADDAFARFERAWARDTARARTTPAVWTSHAAASNAPRDGRATGAISRRAAWPSRPARVRAGAPR
jgi:hypothetical protein